MPEVMALSVLLRPACLRATVAATPNFRKVETLLTILDFNSLRRYNDASDGSTNRCTGNGI